MVNFELGKEIKKDVFRLVTSMGQKKKILSPKNITLSTLLILAVCRTHVSSRASECGI